MCSFFGRDIAMDRNSRRNLCTVFRISSGLEPLQLGDGGPVFAGGFGASVYRRLKRRLGVR